ncbi:MAG TPA: sigma-70 family RNA polymerase sigma factor [Gaiellaceae bacterium]|nr:sigma-70 family RNA polymerase sigma factor [Gaiellaceae bacterium]
MNDVHAASTPAAARPPRETTFAEAAAAHLDDVHAYLVYVTGDRMLAEDLTAATFERALRSWRRFDPRRASARTWLCHVARSTALDWFRAEQRRSRREARAAEAEPRRSAPEPLADGLSPELDAALRRLSPGDREVLALRVVLELDGAAAAALLGITPTACSTRLSRALNRLEEELRDADVR